MNLQFGVEDASYQAAGQQAGISQLVSDFYRLMDSQPEYRQLRNLHTTDLQQSEDKLAVFLTGWLGGPRLYREKYGPISIPIVHQHLNITRDTLEQWMSCMIQAIKLQDYSDEFSDYLITQLRVPAERILMVIEARKPTNQE
ncbi:group II truncated hemoglobin [Aliikangiella marina]|uniref:Group II truncated hemoglobin n=1 Tax=Aliikangiella marina TaxID=1712262 RepID=A0A545T935_9GAMM|nr:group II truncated hemoglobin [Aliikangiella marina]TQV73698.1 group II truncated hemoglobin [Aliikangiella marina]